MAKFPPLFRREWLLAVTILTFAVFSLFGKTWLVDLSNPLWFTLMFGWLFLAILFSALAVVRHAEAIAHRLGEPLGTLVLTISVIGIEVMMIASLMYTGTSNETVARDAMLAVIMIVLNGMVGLSLLVGGWRYGEQTYNLQGANAFLAVILPLAVLSLILPSFTISAPGPSFSKLHAGFLIVMSAGLYSIFLLIQTTRHRHYFLDLDSNASDDDAGKHGENRLRPLLYHSLFLLGYLLPIVLLSKKIAVPIDYGIRVMGAPPAVGGFLVSVLVLFPESIAAIRAARANKLQRSVNLLLGSVLASICLTVPAALAIGFVLHKNIILGVAPVDAILLSLTLVMSALTFAGTRTNVLLGAVHLLLFVAYLMFLVQR